ILEDDAKVSDVLALRAQIEADPAVSHVDYITRDQAMARLVDIASRQPDIQIVDISSNPLPNSLEIKLQNAQDAPRIGATLRQEVGKGVVYEVVDNPSVVDKLLTITRVLSFGGVAVLAMMLVVALFVIVNTIRIAVHARRDEIEIMKLVGASDWFVRWPFILEGMLVGALGAAASLTVLFLPSGAVTSSLLGFLDSPPVSFGPRPSSARRSSSAPSRSRVRTRSATRRPRASSRPPSTRRTRGSPRSPASRPTPSPRRKPWATRSRSPRSSSRSSRSSSTRPRP